MINNEAEMKPCIEINNEILQEIATHLNTLLADEFILNTKTRNAHWNLQGSDFEELQRYFDIQYNPLDTIIGDIAERVQARGHFTLDSLNNYLLVTRLPKHNDDYLDQTHIIQTLLEDHESIIRSLREDIAVIADVYKDLGTAHFMRGLMQQHEKMAGMLRNCLRMN